MRFYSKKTEVNGITFDSQDEAAYYQLLSSDPAVKNITVQPSFSIIQPYRVRCIRCEGRKRILNQKTGNLNKCSLCKGEGFKQKQGATYTADFMVEYQDGRTEFVDVKGGGPVSRDFPLRRKLFEQQMGVELVVMVKDRKKGWVRK